MKLIEVLAFGFEKIADRKSILLRGAYFLVIGFLLFLVTPFIKILIFLNYITIFITGKRNFFLYKVLKTYTIFCYTFDNYINFNSNIVPRISFLKHIWNNIQ